MNPLLYSPMGSYMVGADPSAPATSAPASQFTVFVFGMGVGGLIGLFTMKVAGLI